MTSRATLPVSVSTTTAISKQELFLFTQQLYLLCSAGLNLIVALEACANSTDCPKLKEMIWHVQLRVESGARLSAAMKTFPGVFNHLYVGLVRVGEISGNLSQELGQLTDLLGREVKLRKRLGALLIYPAVVVLVSSVCALFYFYIVLPALRPLFAGMNIPLPALTQLLLAVADGLHRPEFFLALAGSAALGRFLVLPPLRRRYRLDPGFAIWLDGLAYRVPVLASFKKKLAAANGLRFLSVLMASGMSASSCLQAYSESLHNKFLQQQLGQAEEWVRNGSTFGQALLQSEVFPSSAVRLVQAGEEAGCDPAQVLSWAALIYEGELELTLSTAAQLLEPALLALMGVLAAVLVLAALLPMASVLQNL